MNTYSKSDSELLLEEIDLLLGSFGGLKNKSFEYILKHKVRKSTAEMFKDATEKMLLETKENIKNLSVLDLTVAFESTIVQQEKIADLLPECILDLKIDPKIVAGAVISYKGKYKDYSFQTAYEQISTLS